MAVAEPAPLFEARGLRKVYGTGPAAVEALHDVTLSCSASTAAAPVPWRRCTT